LTISLVAGAMAAIGGCGNAVEGDSTEAATGENAESRLPPVVADSANSVSQAANVVEPSVAPGAPTSPGPKSWDSFRNGHAQAGVAGSDLPHKLELSWKYPDVDGFLTAVAIVGPHVYAPALSGYLYCLDRTSGKLIWKYRSIDDADPETFAPGFKAAPTVTADTVFLGDEDGLFHAVDRASGAQRWVFTTEAEIAGGAAVVRDQVIIGSHDSFLYCLNASDGSLVWKFQTEDRVNCSVAIAGKHTFVAGCDEHLRVIDIEEGRQKSDIPLQTYLIASPAVVDNMLYVGTYASEVVAVDWKQKEVVWRYRDPRREFPYHASAAVTDQYVVVGGRDKQMHCIDRATGNGVWTFPTRGRIDSSAVIVDERVFFGSADRNLYGLRLGDGKEIWKFNAEKPVSAGAAIGEGCLVIGSEGPDGFLYCFGEKPGN
jgi:outer membrane protein assembly factor BamB